MVENIENLSLDELISLRKEMFFDIQALGDLITKRQNENEESKYKHLIGKIVKDEDQYLFVNKLDNTRFQMDLVGPTICFEEDGSIRFYEEDYLPVNDDMVEVSFEELNEVLNDKLSKIKTSFKLKN